MLRGILAGGLWGGLIGIITLALSSQLADWRDLTPALTEAEVEERALPDVSMAVSQETPTVPSGAAGSRPTASESPAIISSAASDGTAPDFETQPPGAPDQAEAPQVAGVASTDDAGTTGLNGRDDATARAADLSPTAVPDADAAPALTETETALTPSSLAPDAQEQVVEVAVPDAADDDATPDAPEVLVEAPEAVPQGTQLALATTGDDDRAGALPLVVPDVPAAAETAVEAAPETEADVAVAVAEDAPEIPDTPDTDESEALAESLPDAAGDEPVVTAERAVPEVQADEATLTDEPAVVETAAPEPARAEDDAADVASVEVPEAAEDQGESTEIAEADAGEDVPAENDASVQLAQADGTGTVNRPRVNRLGGGASDNGLPGTQRRTLPTIGDDAGEAATATETAAAAEVEGAAPAEAGAAEEASTGGALAENAISFDRPADAALVSVILIHGPGSAAPEDAPVPLTFAVPTGASDAAAVAEAYRAAGHEVLLVPDLPTGATAQDVEVAMSVTLEDFQGAVGMIDPDGTSYEASRDATAQIIATAARGGFGVVTQGQGFNSAARLAARDGVANAEVLRQLGADMTDRQTIGRALDQAAFRARAEGSAVILGDASEEHIAGILAWALENREGGVVMAPISAVLQDSVEP